jgi:hypothetical protein
MNMEQGTFINRMRETPLSPSVYQNIYTPYWLANYNEKKMGIKQHGRSIAMWTILIALLSIAVQLPVGIWSNYAQGIDAGQRSAFMIWRQGPSAATYTSGYAYFWMFNTGTEDWTLALPKNALGENMSRYGIPKNSAIKKAAVPMTGGMICLQWRRRLQWLPPFGADTLRSSSGGWSSIRRP